MTGPNRIVRRLWEFWALRVAAACLAIGLCDAIFTTPALAQLDPQGAISNPPPIATEDYKRLQLRIGDALRSNQPNKTQKEQIDQWVHYQIYQIAVPDQAQLRVENIKKLFDILKQSNVTANARAYASDQVILRCRQLLAEPALDPRIAAVHTLVGLNSSWNPDIPYVPTTEPLLEALAFADDQFITVKVVAVDGLARILKDAPAKELPVIKRIEITEKLVAEVNRLRAARGQAKAAPKVGYDWLMWGLVRALGFSERVTNQARQPTITDTLQRVMFDRQEEWLTRARAADALSRLPYEANTNLAVLNYEIAQLLHDGAQQYNSECAAGVVNPMWRRFALHVYMSYEAQSQAARNMNQGLMYQVNRSGLGGHKAPIQAVRGLMLPIVNSWISQPLVPDATGKMPLPRPIPAGDIQNLSNWLNGNSPAPGTKLTPESQVAPPAQPAANPQ